MEFLVYIVGILISALFYLHSRRRNTNGKAIPGPKGLPLFGSIFEFSIQTMHSKFCEYAEKYGEIVCVKIFGINIITLNTVETVQKAYSGTDYKAFLNDRPGTFVGEYFYYGNKGIAFCKGGNSTEHNELRKLFTKGFHVYGDGIAAFEAKILCEIANLNRQLRGIGEAEFEMVSLLKRSLSNVLSVFLRGEPIDEHAEDVDIFFEFIDASDILFAPVPNAMYSSIPYVRFVPGKYRQSFQRMMTARGKILEKYFFGIKKTHKRGYIRGFVDYLLDEQTTQYESGEEITLTDEQLKAMVQEIISSGIVTTLSTLSNLFLCLLNNMKYQHKAQEELRHVVGTERQPNLDDKRNCPFIEALIMEAMRYISVAPIGGPHVNEQSLCFEGYDVPAKSFIFPNIWYIHHDEKIWGDPWTFRPERFLDDNGQLLPRGHLLRKSLIPFGAGRRQCIGETFARSRLFLYVSSLLQQWTFIPSPGKVGSCDPRQGDLEINTVIRVTSLHCMTEKTCW